MRFVTDEVSNKVRSTEYDPFGNWRTAQGQAKIHMLFQSQQQDPESELYFLRARYYDPKLGRFISRDPVKGLLTNPQSQNPYAYALNNPINEADPSGEQVAQAVQAVIGYCQKLLCADADCTNEVRAVTNVVYRSTTDNYIGRTTDFTRRSAEHLRESGRVIREIPGLINLSLEQAKAVEQALIEKYGLVNLENIRNSISPNNPIYQEAIKLGNQILQATGL